MIKNVGKIDRLIRAVISSVFIYIGFFDDNLISDPISSTIIGTIGIFNLLVVLTRVCPLYSITDIDSLNKNDK
ncbi:MAG: DUF2892 domain-containing protein [Gammaproteobacteria bacterium]|nr:DUF2892 domain-containing protein [Gammaproteobacteria bacterium]